MKELVRRLGPTSWGAAITRILRRFPCHSVAPSPVFREMPAPYNQRCEPATTPLSRRHFPVGDNNP